MGAHWLVSPPVPLPADVHLPILRFRHYIETELGFDGGQVQIRVNGQAWQTMPAPAFRYNGYNTTLFAPSQGNTNPNVNPDSGKTSPQTGESFSILWVILAAVAAVGAVLFCGKKLVRAK